MLNKKWKATAKSRSFFLPFFFFYYIFMDKIQGEKI